MWLPARPPKMPYSNCRLIEVHAVDVQKVGGAPVRFDVFLGQLKTHSRGIGVAAFDVVDRHGDARRVAMLGSDRFAQVGGKRGDAALSRQVITDKGDAIDRGVFKILWQWESAPSRRYRLAVVSHGPAQKREEAVTVGTASSRLGRIKPSLFYVNVRSVIVHLIVSDEVYKDSPYFTFTTFAGCLARAVLAAVCCCICFCFWCLSLSFLLLSPILNLPCPMIVPLARAVDARGGADRFGFAKRCSISRRRDLRLSFHKRLGTTLSDLAVGSFFTRQRRPALLFDELLPVPSILGLERLELLLLIRI